MDTTRKGPQGCVPLRFATPRQRPIIICQPRNDRGGVRFGQNIIKAFDATYLSKMRTVRFTRRRNFLLFKSDRISNCSKDVLQILVIDLLFVENPWPLSHTDPVKKFSNIIRLARYIRQSLRVKQLFRRPIFVQRLCDFSLSTKPPSEVKRRRCRPFFLLIREIKGA